jgi:hypothetical protein
VSDMFRDFEEHAVKDPLKCIGVGELFSFWIRKKKAVDVDGVQTV